MPRESGKNMYQHKNISWSYLYLGNAALTLTIENATNKTFIIKKNKPSDQAPKNRITYNVDINNILLYSDN
jgi:hypothetical protein